MTKKVTIAISKYCSVCTSTCMHVCLCVHVHVCVFVCCCVFVFLLFFLCVCVCVCVCVSVCLCVYHGVCTCVCVTVCVFLHACKYLYRYSLFICVMMNLPSQVRPSLLSEYPSMQLQ